MASKQKITDLKEHLATRIRKNKVEFLLLLGIILLASFFRLWRIDEYLRFLGDEGRDVRVVRRFLVNFDLMFIGPRTSVGDMYLGPLFYYLIAPSLLLANFSPVGPAILVAILDLCTILLIWFVGKEWFGKVAGITAALLYAVSPVVIEHAGHSWNPNIMPFFALLSIVAIWQVWRKSEFKWLWALAISYAFVLQSHYLGLLLLPTLIWVWVAALYTIDTKSTRKKFFVNSLLGLAMLVVLMSPQFIFDAKHGWRNLNAMRTFFTREENSASILSLNVFPRLWPLVVQVSTRLLTGKDKIWGSRIAYILSLGVIWFLFQFHKGREKKRLQAFILLVSWSGLGVLGLSLYRAPVYDHYFGFMFPAAFLLVGVWLQRLWEKRMRWLTVFLILGLVLLNLSNNPLKYPPGRQMQRVKDVDRKIAREDHGKPFNLALISENNYDESYRYFLEIWGEPIVEINPQKSKETIAEQLFVVCEDSVCNPIGHPRTEIANFGWAKTEREWRIAGVKLFKLVHRDFDK